MLTKKLTDSDLGLGTSNQTHIGLWEEMLEGWTSEDKVYDCFLFIENLETCIPCKGVINAILSDSGEIRSPKIKTGKGIENKINLLKLIRKFATEYRRYLSVRQLPDGKLMLIISRSKSSVMLRVPAHWHSL